MLDQTAILNSAWDHLTTGARDRRHPMHLGVVATVSPSGLPDARTVVLRQADPEQWTVHFHTDWRAPKVTAIRQQPTVVLLFYHPEARIQLRLHTQATLHHEDALSRTIWEQTPTYSRECYLTPHPPSHRAETAPGEPSVDTQLTQEASEAGYVNFTVVRCQIEALDWLHLRAGGHERACFHWQAEQQTWQFHWVHP